MILFLLKGLLRDRTRSLFPVLTVAAGSFLAVFGYSYIMGARNDIIWANAAFDTGHVKLTTVDYAAEADLLPNDLALVGVDSLLQHLRGRYPDLIWTYRTRFGGLVDIPDSVGETRAQAPVMGLALDLSATSPERRILNIERSVVRGRLPESPNEMLISETLARQLGVGPGEVATLIGSTAFGSLTLHNFRIAGTVHFGITAMDRAVVLVDHREAQLMLDMEDAAAEILGFFPDLLFDEKRAAAIAAELSDDPELLALPLHQQNDLQTMIRLMNSMGLVIITIFIIAMSIVLWNAGLMAGLRRYGEIGVRLAIGESKAHVYGTLLAESLMIGIIGSIVGTAMGLAAAYYLQVHGLDISEAARGSSMLITDVIRAQIVPASYTIGLIPGLIAPQLGAMISGIGIFRRQTAQLFKELEV